MLVGVGGLFDCRDRYGLLLMSLFWYVMVMGSSTSADTAGCERKPSGDTPRVNWQLQVFRRTYCKWQVMKPSSKPLSCIAVSNQFSQFRVMLRSKDLILVCFVRQPAAGTARVCQQLIALENSHLE
jgi:hypothetical protein